MIERFTDQYVIIKYILEGKRLKVAFNVLICHL